MCLSYRLHVLEIEMKEPYQKYVRVWCHILFRRYSINSFEKSEQPIYFTTISLSLHVDLFGSVGTHVKRKFHAPTIANVFIGNTRGKLESFIFIEVYTVTDF